MSVKYLTARASAWLSLLTGGASSNGLSYEQALDQAIGSVSPAVQQLALIVPSRHTVEPEVYIENKDIGFVPAGQAANVKIDAYQHSKYGTIPAIVTHISRDVVNFSGNGAGQLAANDNGSNKGLMCAVKATLQKPTIPVYGKK